MTPPLCSATPDGGAKRHSGLQKSGGVWRNVAISYFLKESRLRAGSTEKKKKEKEMGGGIFKYLIYGADRNYPQERGNISVLTREEEEE